MKRHLALAMLTVLLSAVPAAAQFYSPGNEPLGVRWHQITTQDYKVVYPAGMDSLAGVYATWLERAKMPVGATAGHYPNQNGRKPLPVILHPWNTYSNGMVMWAPRRMELYTTPDYLAPLPVPWHEHLAIHESRHVSQLQFTMEKPYRFWNCLVGQLFPGAVSQVYGELAFLEGDAVAAETELTASGRGRNAAFLEYYRAAFREGDFRNWGQWRYGSIKKYTPDHYTLGYITVAGMRSVYDAPDFTARYYGRIFNKPGWPWPLFNFKKTVQEVSGKDLRPAFTEICDTLKARWGRDEAARAPFMPSVPVTAPDRHFSEYTGACELDGTVYAIKSGMTQARELVAISTAAVNYAAGDSCGRAVKPFIVRPFASSTSRLRADVAGHRIWWSELVSDLRWDMKSYSEICYAGHDGRRHCLKHHTRWYNPSVSEDGTRLAVSEYPPEGGSALLVLDAATGEELLRYKAPDGMQVVESEWIDGTVYACAVTPGGQGIYDVADGFRRLLHCGRNVVKELSAHDGELYFVSDAGGVDELYAFNPGNGEARRVSNTAQGASSFVFCDGGLLYSMLKTDGRMFYLTPKDALPQPAEVAFTEPHRYKFAEELTAGGPGVLSESSPAPEVPASQPYSRLLNAIQIHSWAPLYIDYDAVADRSFDSILSMAGLGATAFFQNELNTLQGTLAYNAKPSSWSKWTHKGEARFTYKGLFPVIEANLSVSSAAPDHYFLLYKTLPRSLSLTYEDISGRPSFDASILMYLPMNFSSGGWYRGFIPQLRWSVTNSIISYGKAAPMNRLTASVRGYVMKGTPSACVYPKLGIGAEAGWSGRPGATALITPNAYFYTYGYLPGLLDNHGIRLSATLQAPVGEALFSERYASMLPRGMGDFTRLAQQASSYPFQSRFTADYVFPFLALDWGGLGRFAYVRNLECKLHGDYSFMGGDAQTDPLQLGGVGADLCVVLGNLLWLPFDVRAGVQYYYNIGVPSGSSPHFWDLVFSVDI